MAKPRFPVPVTAVLAGLAACAVGVACLHVALQLPLSSAQGAALMRHIDGDRFAAAALPLYLRAMLRLPGYGEFLAAVHAAGFYAIRARTAWFDSRVNKLIGESRADSSSVPSPSPAAAADGPIEQILVLGSGFDTRFLRYPSLCLGHPGVRKLCIEVDVPSVLDRKRALVASAAAATGLAADSVRFVAFNLTDLAQPFGPPQLLRLLTERKAGFSPDRRTLVVAEGLLGYLRHEEVNATMRFVRDATPRGSLLLFDFMAEFQSEWEWTACFGIPRAHLLAESERRGEPYRSFMRPQEVQRALAHSGFALDVLWSQYMHRQERMALASHDSSRPVSATSLEQLELPVPHCSEWFVQARKS